MDDKLRSRIIKSANDIRKGGFINPAFVNDEYASKELEKDKTILNSGSGIKGDIIITDPKTGKEFDYTAGQQKTAYNQAKDRVLATNVNMDPIHRALTVEGVLDKMRERMTDPDVINDPEKHKKYSESLNTYQMENLPEALPNLPESLIRGIAHRAGVEPYIYINGEKKLNPELPARSNYEVFLHRDGKKTRTRISSILDNMGPGEELNVLHMLGKQRTDFNRMYNKGLKEREKSLAQSQQDLDKKIKEIANALDVEPYTKDHNINPIVKEHLRDLSNIGGLTLGDQSAIKEPLKNKNILNLASQLKTGTMGERIAQAIRAYGVWDRANNLGKFGVKPIPAPKPLNVDEILGELATATNMRFKPGHSLGRRETSADQISTNRPTPGSERLKTEYMNNHPELYYNIGNIAQNVKDWSGWRKVQDGDDVRTIRNGVEKIPVDGEMMKWVYHPDWKNNEFWHKYGLNLISRIRTRLLNTHKLEETLGDIETERAVRRPEFGIKPGTGKPYKNGDPVPKNMIVIDGQIGEREKLPNSGQPFKWAYNPGSKVLDRHVDEKGNDLKDIDILKDAIIGLLGEKKHPATRLDSIGAITDLKHRWNQKEPVKNPILSIIGEKPIIETPHTGTEEKTSNKDEDKKAKSKALKEEVDRKRKSRERKKATYAGELKSKYPEMGEGEKKDTEGSKKSLSVPFRSVLEFRKNNPDVHIMDITKSLERKTYVKNKILKSISMIKKAEDGPMGSDKIVYGNQQPEAPPKEDSFDPDDGNVVYGQNEKGEDLDINGNVMSKQKQKEINVGDYYTGDNQESKEVHDYLNEENIKLQTDKNRQSRNALFDPQLYDRPLDVPKIVSMSKPTKESLQAEYEKMKEMYPEQFSDGKDLIDHFILSDIGKELLSKSRYVIEDGKYTLNGVEIPYEKVKEEMTKAIKNNPELTNIFNVWANANTMEEPASETPVSESSEEENPLDETLGLTPEEIEMVKMKTGVDDVNPEETVDAEAKQEQEEQQAQTTEEAQTQEENTEKPSDLIDIDTNDIINWYN